MIGTEDVVKDMLMFADTSYILYTKKNTESRIQLKLISKNSLNYALTVLYRVSLTHGS